MVRFVSLDILVTGVLAFECALSSLTSVFVHSRRTALPFFFAFVTFNLLAPYFMGAALLTHRRAETTKQRLKITPSRRSHPRAFVFLGFQNDRCWHEPDLLACPLNGRYRGKADMGLTARFGSD